MSDVRSWLSAQASSFLDEGTQKLAPHKCLNPADDNVEYIYICIVCVCK